MTLDQAIDLMNKTFEMALIVGGPVILITFLVGLIVSIFQAATQINEMTLTFIPKIVATLIAIIIFGSWMFRKLIDFTNEIFNILFSLIQ
ncbi:flagellar biosynthesis protein FliQ [Hydrogenothermus marinus]|uniref:Flagellar biosynthetic protein FliQ n=1 Tax=Hydrogenothermus marinus TaxID=133270 RepID=A0A3M0BRK9_9AQUI|nr:flagellar biosynthesis protein FliQ [Hydrogenothermus marinus]RMA97478.1 flagellar biosynthetic protein FliQ [Hydrogenothermus marinus]